MIGRVCVTSVLILSSWGVAAQRPRVSPQEIHDFTLAGSTVSFDYGRPSKRGRDIWGALVPWGRWWMPGADEATILTTGVAVVLGDSLTVPSGRHTIYMLPDRSSSTLIINKEVGQFHTRYNPRLDLGRVELNLRMLKEPVEQLTLAVEPRADGQTALTLRWDDREYWVAIKRSN
jgi:hypothetical protein